MIMTDPNEQPNPNIMPEFHVVMDAYTDIAQYNQRFSGLGSVINDRLANASVSDDGEIDEFALDGITFSDFQQGQAEGEMSADLSTLVNEDTFVRVGVEILPLGTNIGSGEHPLVTTKLTPRIANVTLYKEFLKSISKGRVMPYDDSLLSAAIENLSDVVTTCFDPESRDKMSPDSQDDVTQLGLDSLRTFTEIEDEYKRLGLDAEKIRNMYGDSHPVNKNDTSPAARAQRLADAYENLEYFVKFWGQRLLPMTE